MACRPSGASAVKLLLDEMLSPLIAQQLRDRGHDVEAIAGNALHTALSDDQVMDLARSQGRALVTNNLVDFRPLHHAAITPGGPGHFGMVFMPSGYRRTRSDVGRIVGALEAELAELPGERDLANAETWL
jgi:predicted nuclease of predicted toxin-antitoxin system